ncbi:acyl-CoA-binding domain-containing protein 5A-like isoform X2 [Myripristis murdjan]|uniref:acyl-CoA-binding domain-containing protein 5A-like isoform X2 n=1 Tax=Myripristis murdjan TaxID=586833 RepID=UPI001175F0FA|nr:acyl-CoA-binding domain-containing protein 5A-like isoform X2 [Myripristis murdjan]
MAQEEDKSSLEAKFAAAVRVIRSLPEDGPFQPSDEMMLMFYSYYKQATLGPCNIPRPAGFWDSRGKAKWDAWNSLGNMTKEEAMMNYVDDIQLILETIPISDEVTDLVEKLGNFYTEVDGAEAKDAENEVDKRSFTRPFAKDADELLKPFTKPIMEGFGDLWDDIQNIQDKESNAHGISVSSEETEESKGNIKMERKEEINDSGKGEEEASADEEEDNIEDEEEEEQGWRSADSGLLRVEDRRWRSDTRGSGSSMDPSMSSITNGTHSSLNSELEEEELACSIEPGVESSSYMHFNGHLSDHSDMIPEKNYRATDSDNEEFCDSMEHLAMEEGLGTSKVPSSGPQAASARRKDLWVDSKTPVNGSDDQALEEKPHIEEGICTIQHNSSLSRGRGSQSPRTACASHLCVNVEAACCCISQNRLSVSPAQGNINEQIAVALLRLQDDMAHVLHRLHTLEVLTVSQSRSPSPRQEDSLSLARQFHRQSWWPFHLSPVTVVLTTIWPLIAHWLVHLYLQWKRRKII